MLRFVLQNYLKSKKSDNLILKIIILKLFIKNHLTKELFIKNYLLKIFY